MFSQLDVTLISSCAMAKTGALMLKVTKEHPNSRRTSLAQKVCEGLHFEVLKNFPQCRQKPSGLFNDVLQWGQGSVLSVLEINFIFKIFSDAKRANSIPIKVRISPADVWKISIAISSPKWYAAEIIIVKRNMFRISNTVNPIRNVMSFL